MAHMKPLPKLILIGVGGVGLFMGAKHLMQTGVIPRPNLLKTLVPLKADAVVGHETYAVAVRALPLPSTTPAQVTAPQINYEVWGWNGQAPLIYANGGPVTTSGSFMQKHGVNLHLLREDDTNKNQADLIVFAKALASGDPNPQVGAHFVTDMGDDGAQFFATVNPILEKLGPEYIAEVVGAHGYSGGKISGEDGFWGLPQWRDNPQSARGALIAGVLHAGDWNDAMDWAAKYDIPNNPNDKIYDPNALNWLSTPTYTDAAERYVSNTCVDLPVKGKPSETKHACVNGVVTWTPGDVTLASKRGGLVPLLTTLENHYQMPASMIGIKKWDQEHAALVANLLAASMEAASQIKSNPAALHRAMQASWEVYGHDQTPEYWEKYYKGVVEPDAQGVRVPLGGSRGADLADNLALFGLDGHPSTMEATYNHYGRIVVQQYPNLFPSYPPASQVINTAYVQAARSLVNTPQAPLEETSYVNSPIVKIKGNRAYSIQFETGSEKILPESFPVLDDLADGLLVSVDAVAIHGNTDSTGTPQGNMALSRARANSVKRYLDNKAKLSTDRVQIFADGQDNPVADNSTKEGRAKNRRVQIIRGTVN